MARRIHAPTAARRAAAWALLCAFVLTLPGAPPALAAPAGEQVVEGQATFTREGDRTTIDTATDQTIVEYESFDIEVDEVVRINQPHEAARILNRIPHGDPTRIDGELSSNGIVYVLNPAGVFAGDTAVIDVSGLVAGAGELSNEDFLAGVDAFTELSGDVVVSEGARIEATDAVALVGRRVANYGSIRSEGGMIALVAGDRALLVRIDGHLRVRVDDSGAAPQPVEAGFALTQGGTLDAGAGSVSLTAGDTWSLAMNHTGVTHGREVELRAGGDGLVQVAGTLDAAGDAPGERGGEIRVTGGRVALLDARLDASGPAGGGSVLVGGGTRGGGELPTARRTFVGSEAELAADARTAGDGGTIVVWSDERTGFYGSASARGGATAGDGGFVEISGRSLESRGRIDVGAPRGAAGTLLYDPDRILVLGGAPAPDADGSDFPDTSPTTVVGGDGVAGRILDGDLGETQGGAPLDDPFLIYESEIEGTDANIILEAVTKISAEGTFDNDSGAAEGEGVVVVLPGNDLVIRTTGNGALEDEMDPESERVGIDLGDVEWRVSEGGIITLSTNAGEVDAPVDGEQSSIRAGTLVYGGPEFTENDVGIGVPTHPDVAVRVDTIQGNIEVDEIRTDGADATADRIAADGGNVEVNAFFGDVTVGDVSTTGGSTAGGIPADGGDGGFVAVNTGVGTVSVLGDVDASGGEGLVGFREERLVLGTGGNGGTISITSDPGVLLDLTGEVLIQGDLIARGGDASGSVAVPTAGDPVLVVGAGGLGGTIVASAVAALRIESPDAGRLTIDASSGSGAGAGSPVTATPFAISIVTSGIPVETPEDEPQGDITLDGVDLVADGGDAGNAGGRGGAGGEGGAINVSSERGFVDAADATLRANGGDGAFAFDGTSAAAGSGGAGGVIQVSGEDGVVTGGLEARGGDAENGTGGVGGRVVLSSVAGDVEVRGPGGLGPDLPALGADVSGGDAVRVTDETLPVGTSVFAGGMGGSVVLRTGQEGAVDPTGGDVAIGDVLRSRGGAGVRATRPAEGDPVSDEATVAAGGDVSIAADGAVGVTGLGTLVEAGLVDVEAAAVGVDLAGDPTEPADALVLAGTDADADRATVAATGEIQVEVSGSSLESLTVVQRDGASDTTVLGGGATRLAVSGDAGTRSQTVDAMATADGDGALFFRFEEALDPTADPPVEPGEVLVAGDLTVGADGGGIANGTTPTASNAGAVLSAGGSVTTTGRFTLAGATLGEVLDPIAVGGTSAGALDMAADGAVRVDVTTALGAIGVTQSDAGADTEIQLTGTGESILVESADGPDAELAPRQTVTALTSANGAGFAYRLVAGIPVDEDTGEVGTAPALDVAQLVLGGSGLLEAPGDIEIAVPGAGPTIAVAGGSDLTLVSGGDVAVSDGAAGVAIDMGGVDGDGEDADLVFVADGAVGSEAAPIVTRGIERLAATHGGGFHLENREAGDVRIAELVRLDPLDLSGETDEGRVSGILAPADGEGDVVIDNAGRRIVLGRIPVQTLASNATHIASTGDIRLVGDVEVDNAQFVPTATLDERGETVTELVAVNRGRLFALGDVEVAGRIDTAAGATAVDEREDVPDPVDPEPAAGEFSAFAEGTVTLGGDVGLRDAEGTLAVLDVSDVRLADADDGTSEIRAGRVLFRGLLDSDGPVSVQGVDVGASDAFVSAISFGGDVGTRSDLVQLDLEADAVNFAIPAEEGGEPLSAERVVVGSGGITIDADPGEIPIRATITDVVGDLRIATAGDFTIAEYGKLSATGTLEVRADGDVTVGDLSADAIRLRADADRDGTGEIRVRLREAGRVELPDGTIVFEVDGPTDGGVDLVANDIALGSNPVLVGAGPRPTLVIGSGGLSIPGSLEAWNLIRYTPALEAVERADFVSITGEVLDLRGTGGAFAGNPSAQLEREAHVDPPPVPSRAGGDAPAAAPAVGGRAAFAYLRCADVGALGAADPGCAAEDAAVLRGLEGFERSALATPRARELARRYRALLRGERATARLREDFAVAERAFQADREWRDGTLDGAALYRFLAVTGAAPGALAALRELDWLDAQIALLGLADGGSALREQLVREFAQAAALPGLDAEQVRAALDASPVGLARS